MAISSTRPFLLAVHPRRRDNIDLADVTTGLEHLEHALQLLHNPFSLKTSLLDPCQRLYLSWIPFNVLVQKTLALFNFRIRLLDLGPCQVLLIHHDDFQGCDTFPDIHLSRMPFSK